MSLKQGYPVLFVCAVSTLWVISTVNADDLGIVPTPRKIEWGQSGVLLDENTVIGLSNSTTEREKLAVRNLIDALRTHRNQTLRTVDLQEAAGTVNSILIGWPSKDPVVAERMQHYGLHISEAMQAEGYVLGIGPKGIVIGAESEAGLLYGAISLKQAALCRPVGAVLPGVRIHDWPAIGMRGIHDENSYGQVSTTANFKDMIRFLAEFKMNTLGLYIEDIFRFDAYPFIGVGRGAFTREQIDELEEFAAQYHVQIIPMFEMLANQGMLLSLPEMVDYAEYPGAHSFAINDKSYEFFSNTVRELAQAFDSPYLHAGLDESWDIGFGKTEQAVKEKGRDVVHAEWYRRLHEIICRNGKKMIMYADIALKHPEILKLLPNDIIMNDWYYGPADRYESLETLRKYKYPVLVLPGMNNWHKFFPTLGAAMVNIGNFNREAARMGAIGSLTCTWGDDGSKNLRELLYYGYAYGGETAWSPETADVEDFSNRFYTLWNGPGAASRLRAVNALLEKWPWNRPIMDYFRHPFLTPPAPLVPLAKFETEELSNYRVLEDARVAETLAREVKTIASRRQGDMDYLIYCARTHQNYVNSRTLARDLQRYKPEMHTQDEVRMDQGKFVQRIQQVREEMTALRDMFEGLWLRTNVPANLNYAIDEYNMFIKVWADCEQRVRNGLYAWDPRTPAQWIYHPDGFADKTDVKTACFRKSVNILGSVQRAHLQIIGDTHVKIYVNGAEIGEQYIRRNLSAPINPNLLQIYDIAALLREGKNVIAVWARNYGSENSGLEPLGPDRCGGLHAYGEIQSADGILTTISTDETWKTSDQETAGWTSVDFNDSRWKNARGSEKNWDITMPDFETGMKGYCSRGR